MDGPLGIAATLLVPFLLGLGLRWKGAFLAGFVLAAYALVLAADDSDAQLLGATVLGAAGGLALGWAGTLTRRLLRRAPTR